MIGYQEDQQPQRNALQSLLGASFQPVKTGIPNLSGVEADPEYDQPQETSPWGMPIAGNRLTEVPGKGYADAFGDSLQKSNQAQKHGLLGYYGNAIAAVMPAGAGLELAESLKNAAASGEKIRNTGSGENFDHYILRVPPWAKGFYANTGGSNTYGGSHFGEAPTEPFVPAGSSNVPLKNAAGQTSAEQTYTDLVKRTAQIKMAENSKLKEADGSPNPLLAKIKENRLELVKGMMPTRPTRRGLKV
jgi:hypothetical protein